jgi:hypothetical protein
MVSVAAVAFWHFPMATKGPSSNNASQILRTTPRQLLFKVFSILVWM